MTLKEATKQLKRAVVDFTEAYIEAQRPRRVLHGKEVHKEVTRVIGNLPADIVLRRALFVRATQPISRRGRP